jgi:hypothetical protein
MAEATEYMRRGILGLGRPKVGRLQPGPKAQQTGDTTPW